MADRTDPASDSPQKPRKPLWIRMLAWTAFIAFLLIAAAFTVFAIYFHRAGPILKERVVETLATRYDSRVELASFNVSVLHGFEVTGAGLKLYPNTLDMQQPLFSVDQFRFRTSWHDLFRTPMHIGVVRITGLDIHLPPKDQRHNMPKLNQHASQGKIQILVDHIDIDRASLILGTNKPGKVPLDFEIINLRMTSVGAGQPMRFHAILVNAKPIGDIDSTGSFGPFNAHSPGDTPVNGTYTFSHADLDPLKGIGGTLSSTGQYQGTLNNITVDGETDTPNFSLDTTGNPVPLHTTFHAIVDGTNGDTHLEPVDAMLLHSHIVARGDVITVPGQGHQITLDVTVQPAHIQDVLALAEKTQPALMSGALVLHTKLVLPPGKQSVTQKIRLDGAFDITNVHFSDPKIQEKIDELSLRSQGHAKEAKQNAENNINTNIASDMKGNFTLGNGKVTITGLRYTVPGANIALNGVYSLDGNQVDFQGTARLTATVSQMVTGWKSWLLKPVDPFFSKNGAGTQVPIQITGTRSNLHFGLDFGRKGDKDKKPDGNRIP
ncbi:MAG: AsmA-like C-terminal region-containing protein [Silvibacterium sp.]